ncbi:heat shock protein 27-like [Ooceraea biroi]|nr:heat shock protein 27-like [Ooceraea biroi]
MSRYRATLIPKLFSHWWETLERPHRLMDQRFAINPTHFFEPSFFDRRFPTTRTIHVCLDVQQFEPDEITVKVLDDFVVVEGKHEEKKDEHGSISRHFIRKYMVPEQCDSEKLTSTLSLDGVLTITAPRKPEAEEARKERVINIEHTGKSAVEDDPEIKQGDKK